MLEFGVLEYWIIRLHISHYFPSPSDDRSMLRSLVFVPVFRLILEIPFPVCKPIYPEFKILLLLSGLTSNMHKALKLIQQVNQLHVEEI